MIKTKLAMAAVLCLSQVAIAQETFGEALDMGAKMLTKDEWLAILPVRATGITSTGRLEFDLTYKPDGTFSGNVRSLQHVGATSGSYGTWTMSEEGQRCLDETFSSWNMKWQGCGYLFKLKDKIFVVEKGMEADRSTKIQVNNYTSIR